LGIGDWGLGPIPNPQSPIPNPQLKNIKLKFNIEFKLINYYLLIKLNNFNMNFGKIIFKD